MVRRQVLEHLPNPERLLQDCRRVLKINGQVLVSVPNVADITVRMPIFQRDVGDVRPGPFARLTEDHPPSLDPVVAVQSDPNGLGINPVLFRQDSG